MSHHLTQDNEDIIANAVDINALDTRITGVETKTNLITIGNPQHLDDHGSNIILNASNITSLKNNLLAGNLKTAVDTNTAKTRISSAQSTKLGHITITSAQDLDVHGTQINTNVTNITLKTDKTINRCLEKICGVCDGRKLYPNYLKSAGTKFITLSNVNAAFSPNQSWQDIPGSEITYQPPSLGTFDGATRATVIYKYSFHMSKHDTATPVQGDNEGLASYRFLIDDANNGTYTELTIGKQVVGTSPHYGRTMDLELYLTIDSGETKDIASGVFDTWTSPKKIKCQVWEYSTSTEFNLFQPMYYQSFFLPTNGSSNVPLFKPQISIETYGHG